MAQYPRMTKDDSRKVSDLTEEEVDLPTLKMSVKIKSLSNHYSTRANSEAVELTEIRGQQRATINQAKVNAIKVRSALVDPLMDSFEEATDFLKRCGPAASTLINAIDEISGIDADTAEETEARFPAGRSGETSEE